MFKPVSTLFQRIVPGTGNITPPLALTAANIPWQRHDTYTAKLADTLANRFWLSDSPDPYQIGKPTTKAIDTEYLDQIFGDRFPRTNVYLDLPNENWQGIIGIRDTHIHQDKDKVKKTIVFTSGWSTRCDVMFGDILYRLLEEVDLETTRIIAMDMPGHGMSDKPSPQEFSYSLYDMAAVMKAALQKLQIHHRYIHVTQSLGYLLSMSDIIEGDYQISSTIAYGTTPEQLGFHLMVPFNQRKRFLLNHSPASLLIEKTPHKFLDYATAYRLFVYMIAQNSPKKVVDAFLDQTNDPAYLQAIFATISHIGEYVEMGNQMYQPPHHPNQPDEPIRFTLIGGKQDYITPPKGVREHAQRLNDATNEDSNHPFSAKAVFVQGQHYDTGNNEIRNSLMSAIRKELEK